MLFLNWQRQQAPRSSRRRRRCSGWGQRIKTLNRIRPHEPPLPYRGSDTRILDQQCPPVGCRRAGRQDRESPAMHGSRHRRCRAQPQARFRSRPWLRRGLAGPGTYRQRGPVVGTDAVESLVEAARCAGGGEFHRLSYEEIAAGKLTILVDAVVCNFSLIGKESVEGIFRIVPSLLHPRGSFLVQTLHPLMACGNVPYRDGWREGSWPGSPRISPTRLRGSSEPWRAG